MIWILGAGAAAFLLFRFGVHVREEWQRRQRHLAALEQARAELQQIIDEGKAARK